jgi:hypothetical protein
VSSLRSYTAHVRPGRAPVLVAEGFSWWALLLPLPWLLANRLWLVSVIWTALAIGAGVLAALAPPAGIAAAVALFVGTGVFARDLRRFSLGLAGWRQAAVVVAPDHDAALARLLSLNPGIAAESYGGRS